MIVVVSANPALDHRIYLEALCAGGVNRATRAEVLAGGKGAHVAYVARALGEPVTLLGFFGAASGDEHRRSLAAAGISVECVGTAAPTRVNLELIEPNQRVTEVLEPGGPIRADEAALLETRVGELLAKHGARSVLVLSGSLPTGVDAGFYARVLRLARGRAAAVLLDTSGAALAQGLSGGPDLVKPNHDEASALLGAPVASAEDALRAARMLCALGAARVVLSRGAQGLIGCEAGSALLVRGPVLTGNSAVGAGDAAVAALAVAARRGLAFADSLVLAAACGAVNCLAPAPGRIDATEVERYARRVLVSPLAA